MSDPSAFRPNHLTALDEVEPELRSRLDFALRIERDARSLILGHYLNPDLEVERKGDASPVTIADRGAEEVMREAIVREFPEDGILGEEFEDVKSENGFRWILDPIDGTKSFIHGVPLFGTLIGIERNGVSEVGVCGLPGLGEVVYAATGGGCWWDRGTGTPTRCNVSEVSRFDEALLCITDFTKWAHEPNLLPHLIPKMRLVRGWGDCYAHVLVATGRAELCVEPAMSAWDAAALVPILQEAGGHFISWDGKPSHTASQLCSVNAELRDQLVSALAESRS